jgi:phospholipid N-methyltransferase/heme-degrading monooxygenase HmoA
MYCYVWEFRVPSERREAFEADYGPEGGWVALFRRDPDWVRTELLRDQDDPQRYLTLDVWASREACLAFRERFRAELDALDRRGATWTEEERLVGELEIVGGAAAAVSAADRVSSRAMGKRSERRQDDDRVAFLQGFLRHPERVGSVVPSSRFLERRIVEAGEIERAEVVVELGPGTGGTTRALLRALSAEARLLAIEIDPRFVARLEEVSDPRLVVHHGSAEHIREALARHDLGSADTVVSGIPFSTMPDAIGRRILREIWDSLAPGGRFVAYQFRDRVADLGAEIAGAPQVEVELLNVPPMRVYSWRK